MILVDKSPPSTVRIIKRSHRLHLPRDSISEASINPSRLDETLYDDVDPWFSASSDDIDGDTRLYTSQFVLHALPNSRHHHRKLASLQGSDPDTAPTIDHLRFIELEIIRQAARYWATTFRALDAALDWLETSLFSNEDLQNRRGDLIPPRPLAFSNSTDLSGD